MSDQKVPPLAVNEILVKVYAALINPVDVPLWRLGLVAVVTGDKGMSRDFSGEVVSVGKAVKGWPREMKSSVYCSVLLVKAPSVNI